MKRKIVVLISFILLIICLGGCSKQELFCGWIDDTEALSIKLTRMNQSEVHNLLGNPVAMLVGSESDVYLNGDELGVFIHYGKNGEVVSVEEEYSETKKELALTPNLRYKIMNKIISRRKDEIIDRYGEPDSASKDGTVIKYKNFDGVKVSILFDQNNVAQKLSFAANETKETPSTNQSSNKVNTDDPVALLNDITALRQKVTGMNLSDFLTLFGKPKGEMETDDCRVYFDSNKNCVFFYFDELRKVTNVEKFEAATLEGNDRYCLTDEELLTVFMNEFIGKTKKEMQNEYGRTRYNLTTPNAYGYTNLYGKRVYVYYDSNNVLEKVVINIESGDFADMDISVIREKSIGLSPDDNRHFIYSYRGYVHSKNCVVRLDSRGDAIVLYYSRNEEGISSIYKVEKLDGEKIKVNGANNEIEKMVTVLHHFSGKERYQIEEEFGKPDIKNKFSENYVGYNNIYGNKIMVLYYTDIVGEKTEMVYVNMY